MPLCVHTHVSYYNKLIPTRRHYDTRPIRPYMVQETSHSSSIIYIYLRWTLLVLPRDIKHVVLAIPLWMVSTLITTKETIMSYTNITLCPQCGNITDDKCCNEDLILYESQHETFIDSIIPLIKEMSDD